MTFVPTINLSLSILTVIGQFIVVALLVSLIFRRKNSLLNFLGKNALLFSFIVVTLATLGSLFYSEIAGYTPCKLCWYQRILMYPQTIILGLALYKKDKNILVYTLALAILGALIAFYHYLLQIGAAPTISCAATGYSVNCSQNFVMQFGYITIPMMSLTVFLLLIFFALAQKFSQKA